MFVHMCTALVNLRTCSSSAVLPPLLSLPYQTSASELEELTMRWRKAAQEVAQDISSCSHCMHECPVTVGRLLSLLHIPNSLLRYSEEEETFTD